MRFRKLFFALLFLTGGISHEIRNPVSCHCIATGQPEGRRRREGKAAPGR